MKLQLKHLAPYLPYRLKLKTKHGWCIMQTLNDWSVNGDCEESLCYETKETTDFKPILRPLSDLTKEIEHNRENFVPIEYGCNGLDLDLQNLEREIRLNKSFFQQLIICEHKYKTVQKLFEWHFDIFGLIENNLAIDINTIS